VRFGVREYTDLNAWEISILTAPMRPMLTTPGSPPTHGRACGAPGTDANVTMDLTDRLRTHSILTWTSISRTSARAACVSSRF